MRFCVDGVEFMWISLSLNLAFLSPPIIILADNFLAVLHILQLYLLTLFWCILSYKKDKARE
jgi:hypothetical protein